jgi:DNA-directed RNA polymerase specialized sigma24 family protein
MDVKEYLCRYHVTEEKILKLQQIVAEYLRLANTIPGVNLDQIRVDGTRRLDAPFEKWILKALDDELLIEELKKQLPLIKCEIISLIDELEDKEYKMILIHRYIDWLSWTEISQKLYYSSSKIRRMHDKALEEISVLSKGKVEQG